MDESQNIILVKKKLGPLCIVSFAWNILEQEKLIYTDRELPGAEGGK